MVFRNILVALQHLNYSLCPWSQDYILYFLLLLESHPFFLQRIECKKGSALFWSNALHQGGLFAICRHTESFHHTGAAVQMAAALKQPPHFFHYTFRKLFEEARNAVCKGLHCVLDQQGRIFYFIGLLHVRSCKPCCFPNASGRQLGDIIDRRFCTPFCANARYWLDWQS